MRTIKARDVKPGMEVRFDLMGWEVIGAVARVDQRSGGMWLYTDQGLEMSLDLDQDVTVLAEPQPEEPTAFGACVRVGGVNYVRFQTMGAPPRPWTSEERVSGWLMHRWGDITSRGLVEVVNPDPFATAAPVVPDRIEEWPENDEALRAHKWRDADWDVWVYAGGAWRWGAELWGDWAAPIGGPWERVTDA